MAQRTTEIIVGLFMIAGCAALLVLALQVSGLSPISAESTYTIYANFNDTGGLTPRGRVSMAGVTVGTIESISLNKETFQARVEMSIHSDVDNIPSDSSAVIRTSGLLGEQYIDISINYVYIYINSFISHYNIIILLQYVEIRPLSHSIL